MEFDLNKEKALDVLIWWVEGSDGTINYMREEAVRKALDDISYSMENYYKETILHIGGLSTQHLIELVEDAIVYGEKYFSEHWKQLTVALLYAVAESDGAVSPDQQEKIDRIKQVFGVGHLRHSPKHK